ncbi:MAG: hypothetical protein IJT95_00820 [Abditibacteriota bacterium]|nr:hypothetical protein [Abditibacteriota bacterium]
MKLKAFWLLWLVLCCLPLCALEGGIEADEGKVINPGIIGPGVNFSFSDYEYFNMITGAQWTGIQSRHLPFPGDQKEWERFERLMDYAGFSYIRLCVGVNQWEPVNDNSDPWDTDLESGFIFSPGFRKAHPELPEENYLNDKAYMDALYTLLGRWTRQNKYVVLGNWDEDNGNFGGPLGNWLKSPDAPKNRRGLYCSIPELTESLAAVCRHLRRDKGFTCVKGVSFYNEPEGYDRYYDTLTEVYGTLGSQLERLGIRDMIKIQGFDGAVLYSRETGNTEDGVKRLLDRAGNNIDIVSCHDYWSCFEYDDPAQNKAHGTIRTFSEEKENGPAMEQIAEYNRIHGRDIDYVIGELGAFAYSPTETGPAVFKQRLHSAEYTARAFNHGVKAVAYWVYNTNYHSAWRMLTFDEDGHFCPDPVNYYPLALVMRYIPGGADVFETRVTGCLDENGVQRVWCCGAVKGRQKTLLVVNDGPEARVTLPAGWEGFRHLYVTDARKDRIYEMPKGSPALLEAESINVFTNARY